MTTPRQMVYLLGHRGRIDLLWVGGYSAVMPLAPVRSHLPFVSFALVAFLRYTPRAICHIPTAAVGVAAQLPSLAHHPASSGVITMNSHRSCSVSSLGPRLLFQPSLPASQPASQPADQAWVGTQATVDEDTAAVSGPGTVLCSICLPTLPR